MFLMIELSDAILDNGFDYVIDQFKWRQIQLKVQQFDVTKHSSFHFTILTWWMVENLAKHWMLYITMKFGKQRSI